MQFDPSRWLDERLQKHVLSNPFNFVPFNAGMYAHNYPFYAEVHEPVCVIKGRGFVSGSR